jgi:AraC-like DNA-binding protein
MNYREIQPCESLKKYVKCYYIFESLSEVPYQDKAFATGCIELMFNIGNGKWQTAVNNEFITTPAIELWGQIINPLTFRSLSKNTMLGIRFFPHTASLFINEKIELFNNQVTDFYAVAGKQIKTLHEKLIEASSLHQRIEMIETYLLQKLFNSKSPFNKIGLIADVMNELKRDDFFDNLQNLALKYGITSRYLQKLFVQYTGLTPKLYSKINRFQNSLQLISKNQYSLTSVAYECNYFDQSHFIREFKSFTGINPSAFNAANSSAVLISANK